MFKSSPLSSTELLPQKIIKSLIIAKPMMKANSPSLVSFSSHPHDKTNSQISTDTNSLDHTITIENFSMRMLWHCNQPIIVNFLSNATLCHFQKVHFHFPVIKYHCKHNNDLSTKIQHCRPIIISKLLDDIKFNNTIIFSITQLTPNR